MWYPPIQGTLSNLQYIHMTEYTTLFIFVIASVLCVINDSCTDVYVVKVKVKVRGFILCPRWQVSRPQGAQTWITQFNLQTAPCLPSFAFTRWRRHRLWLTATSCIVVQIITSKAVGPKGLENDVSTRPSSALCDLDLLHPCCCDTIGVYCSMCLLSLVKICPIVLKISGQKGFLWPSSVPHDLDLSPPGPNVDCLMPLPCRPNVHQNPFVCCQNIVFTSLVTDAANKLRKDRWTTRDYNASTGHSGLAEV